LVSPEGDRYIGEAEGKENKAVNIDKLGQLERNIQEDFARDEVQEPARGILLEMHIDYKTQPHELTSLPRNASRAPSAPELFSCELLISSMLPST